MAEHLIDGEFQSDKYPTCPRGKVPLSCKDVTAQDLLWEYAQRRRVVDADFADDLEAALHIAGYKHDAPTDAPRKAAEEIAAYLTVPIPLDPRGTRFSTDQSKGVAILAAIIARHCPDSYAEGKAAGLEEIAEIVRGYGTPGEKIGKIALVTGQATLATVKP